MRSASNLPPSTTWLPASSAVIVQMNGPLWYSGPGIRCVPSSFMPSSGARVGIDRGWPGSRGSASGGRSSRPTSSPCTGSRPRRASGTSSRPVDVERRCDDHTRPRELDDRVELALRQAGRHRLRRRAELPARDGRRHEPTPFGSAIVTRSSWPTPLRRERARGAVRERLELGARHACRSARR